MKYFLAVMLLVSLNAHASSDQVLKGLNKADKVLYNARIVNNKKYYKGSDPKQVEAAVRRYQAHRIDLSNRSDEYAKQYPQPKKFNSSDKNMKCLQAATFLKEVYDSQGLSFDALKMYNSCMKGEK